jgi:hypothetical protein
MQATTSTPSSSSTPTSTQPPVETIQPTQPAQPPQPIIPILNEQQQMAMLQQFSQESRLTIEWSK